MFWERLHWKKIVQSLDKTCNICNIQKRFVSWRWPLTPFISSCRPLCTLDSTALRLLPTEGRAAPLMKLLPTPSILSDQYMRPPASESFLQPWAGHMTPRSAPKTLSASPHTPLNYLPHPAGGRQTASTGATHSRANTLPTTSTTKAVSESEHIPTHHPLGYYSEKPLHVRGSISGANAGAWSSGRPSPQYLNHPHHRKPGSSLGWGPNQRVTSLVFVALSGDSRFQAATSLLDPHGSRCSKTSLKSLGRTPGWKPPR